MNGVTAQDRQRQIGVMASPALWPTWPFLPLVRRQAQDDDFECGLMSELPSLEGITGYRATVFLSNLFLLPPTLDEFMSLKREVFDTVEELYAAGWRID